MKFSLIDIYFVGTCADKTHNLYLLPQKVAVAENMLGAILCSSNTQQGYGMFTSEMMIMKAKKYAVENYHYAMVNEMSVAKVAARISQKMPQGTKKILLFASKGMDLVGVKEYLAELWDIEVVGCVTAGIGDCIDNFSMSRYLAVFLDNKVEFEIQKIKDLELNSQAMIFTNGDSDTPLKDLDNDFKHEVFGCDTFEAYGTNRRVEKDEALVIKTWRLDTVFSNLVSGKDTDFKFDFLTCLDTAFNKWPIRFIITCFKRIENMSDKTLKNLEDNKCAKYGCREEQGFGFAGYGVYRVVNKKLTFELEGLGMVRV